MRIKTNFWYLCLLITLSASAEPDNVILGTNISASEFVHADAGGSVTHVECIAQRLGLSLDVYSMPWRRARQEVSTAKIDGFFTAIPIPEVDRYATLTAPLVLENWYWIWRQGVSSPDSWHTGFRLGAILGSHQTVWLQQNGYSVHLQVGNLEQLTKLMISGRIDAFIADRDHMEAVAQSLGIAEQAYQRRFLRYVPLGVYFGNEFLVERPGFLRRFNRQIYGCAPEAFSMSDSEQRRIREWLGPLLEQWLRDTPILEAALEQNERHTLITQADISEQDRQWIEEYTTRDYDMATQMLGTELSRRLRELAVDADGRVTEVIVMDEHGLNVAISDITTDYWQGDEKKFQEAQTLLPGEMRFGPVSYDESTRRFQVNVSRALYHPESFGVVGVISVGVDVEKALSLKQ